MILSGHTLHKIAAANGPKVRFIGKVYDDRLALVNFIIARGVLLAQRQSVLCQPLVVGALLGPDYARVIGMSGLVRAAVDGGHDLRRLEYHFDNVLIAEHLRGGNRIAINSKDIHDELRLKIHYTSNCALSFSNLCLRYLVFAYQLSKQIPDI